MNILSKTIEQINTFLWNFPMLVLLLGTHIYFTIKSGVIQRLLPKGIRLSLSGQTNSENGITPYAALSTALAATIGTGNIIGISTAIAIGGPGAVFWCWITGVFGIATCYAEAFLSSKYHVKNENKTYTGGPMYVLKNVLRMKYAAMAFALFTILASFGIGSSVQANSICTAIRQHLSVSPHIIGIVTALAAGFIVLGGVRQIAKFCTFLVPLMSIFYLVSCGYLLLLNRHFVTEAVFVIVKSAFYSKSFIGGMTGTAVIIGIRTGISRGLFTNEAGLGSIPMTSAASDCTSPFKQGLISMTGPFWDTVVICAVTGVVIVSSMLHDPFAFSDIAVDRLCFQAFSLLPFSGEEMLSVSLVLFAFATIIGWCYYGECCVSFLTGNRGLHAYHTIYIVFIYLGMVIPLQLVWDISSLLNSLMAIPNLLCLWLLRNHISFQDIPKNKSP